MFVFHGFWVFFSLALAISFCTSLITGYSELGNRRMKGGCPSEQKPASVENVSPGWRYSDDGPACLVGGEEPESDFTPDSGVCKGSAGPPLTDSPLHAK